MAAVLGAVAAGLSVPSGRHRPPSEGNRPGGGWRDWSAAGRVPYPLVVGTFVAAVNGTVVHDLGHPLNVLAKPLAALGRADVEDVGAEYQLDATDRDILDLARAAVRAGLDLRVGSNP